MCSNLSLDVVEAEYTTVYKSYSGLLSLEHTLECADACKKVLPGHGNPPGCMLTIGSLCDGDEVHLALLHGA